MRNGNTHHRLAFAAGTVALSGLLASRLAANTPAPGGEAGEPRAFRRAARQLRLTEEQQKQIRGILRSHAAEIEAQMHASRDGRKALRGAMEAQPLDEAQVRVRALALGEVKADSAVLRARIRSEIWPVLTAEQQEEAKDLRGLRGLKSKRRLEAFERWLRKDG